MSWRRSWAVVLAVAVLAGPSLVRADRGDAPSDARLVLAGAAMAVPTYVLGVAVHEGGHALAATLAGATVTELTVWPAVEPQSGRFYFGFTRYRGRLSRAERTWFLLAPKLTDLVVLTGYTVLVELDELPSDPYLRLATTVVATGHWVDFSKDVLSRNAGNDTVKLYTLRGHRSEWQRLPYRVVHAGLAIASAFVLARGYRRVFARSDGGGAAPLVIQMLAGRF